jgi:hypothetical protein
MLPVHKLFFKLDKHFALHILHIKVTPLVNKLSGEAKALKFINFNSYIWVRSSACQFFLPRSKLVNNKVNTRELKCSNFE